MGETSSRGKSIAIAIALLVVVLAAAGFLATQWGVSRALTVLVAIVLVGALAWGILIVVGILSAASARREPDDSDTTLRNEQRPVTKRIILPEDRQRPVGHRRKNPDDA